MSLTKYFDTRHGCVAIVEAEFPEEGFEALEEGQSELGLRYALDADGAVIDQYPGKTDAEVLQLILDSQKKEETSATDTKVITRLQFMDLFTMPELAAVYTAAKSSVMIEVFLDKWKMAEFIDLRDPNTIAGVNGLADAGLITKERVPVILA